MATDFPAKRKIAHATRGRRRSTKSEVCPLCGKPAGECQCFERARAAADQGFVHVLDQCGDASIVTYQDPRSMLGPGGERRRAIAIVLGEDATRTEVDAAVDTAMLLRDHLLAVQGPRYQGKTARVEHAAKLHAAGTTPATIAKEENAAIRVVVDRARKGALPDKVVAYGEYEPDYKKTRMRGPGVVQRRLEAWGVQDVESIIDVLRDGRQAVLDNWPITNDRVKAHIAAHNKNKRGSRLRARVKHKNRA